MQTYIITEGPRGKKIHRGTCKRISAGSGTDVLDLDHFTTAVEGAIPATCCKPNRDEIVRLAKLAKAKHADTERAAADERIAQLHADPSAPNNVVAIETGKPLETKTPKAGRGQVADERYREACKVQAAGPRGKGTPVTDEELDAYVGKVMDRKAGLSVRQETHIMYWTERFACSDSRFAKAWDRVSDARAAQKRSHKAG